jgi:hypothetical protein
MEFSPEGNFFCIHPNGDYTHSLHCGCYPIRKALSWSGSGLFYRESLPHQIKLFPKLWKYLIFFLLLRYFNESIRILE